jgi:hypothetical protein
MSKIIDKNIFLPIDWTIFLYRIYHRHMAIRPFSDKSNKSPRKNFDTYAWLTALKKRNIRLFFCSEEYIYIYIWINLTCHSSYLRLFKIITINENRDFIVNSSITFTKITKIVFITNKIYDIDKPMNYEYKHIYDSQRAW